MHKFNIGQTVFLERSLAVPGGARVITKRLPERGGEFEYRVKSEIDLIDITANAEAP
jgi:hypothetical protein